MVLAEPSELVSNKEFASLDEFGRGFIARSPFVLIASSDGAGAIDVSPKGDPPGFVRVLDDTTLAIPDRLGNHRTDTFENVLRHPFVGLVFLTPGTKNTLRVQDRAKIVRDERLRDSMQVDGRAPELALVVEVTRAAPTVRSASSGRLCGATGSYKRRLERTISFSPRR